MAESRFQFGQNWQNFLTKLTEERIVEAELSLKQMLQVENLHNKHFLDIGSGSGLFSLAARRLGAVVHSFDYDPQSVACTQELKRRYFPDDDHWEIEHGSVLDTAYLKTLGEFDVVYAWGVLHHTGDMWQALENIVPLVTEGGKLFIAIYNDQGMKSKLWRQIKFLYTRLPRIGQMLLVLTVGLYWEAKHLFFRLIRGKNPLPFPHWSKKKKERGMAVWYDLVDWVGGYPFEVATPGEIFDFYAARNFTLTRLVTVKSGHGNNQFVFIKKSG